MITSLKSVCTTAVAPFEQGNISAMILDDNQFDRLKIRRLFNTTGIPVFVNESDTLPSLKEALDKKRFDVILVDYNLNESTGIEALRLVQQHPLNSDAALIMITGYDQSAIAVKALKMGCKDYIAKDELSPEKLRASVLSAIEQNNFAKFEKSDQSVSRDALARDLMAQYSDSLQPEIAQLIRELRKVKDDIGRYSEEDLFLKIDSIEQRCIRLWSELGTPKLPVAYSSAHRTIQ